MRRIQSSNRIAASARLFFGAASSEIVCEFEANSVRIPEIDKPIKAIDWSDWLMMVRPEFPDDVTYAIAWAACNTTDIIERQYRHLPPDISPLTYPLVPKKIAASALPLPGCGALLSRGGG